MFVTLRISQVVLDPKTSRKIFELAKDQQREVDPDLEDDDEEDEEDGNKLSFLQTRSTIEVMEDEDDDEDLQSGDDNYEEEYPELVRLFGHS